MTTAKNSSTTTKKNRRSPEQIVADLEAKIAKVKEREATKGLRSDPAVKATSAAVRAVNKALGEAKEPELVEALQAAKGVLADYLEGKGLRVPAPGKKRKEAAAAA